ncbi:hypothetical protein AHiyo6_14580, partial [Arthrobacter sp. Hiyo6]
RRAPERTADHFPPIQMGRVIAERNNGATVPGVTGSCEAWLFMA